VAVGISFLLIAPLLTNAKRPSTHADNKVDNAPSLSNIEIGATTQGKNEA